MEEIKALIETKDKKVQYFFQLRDDFCHEFEVYARMWMHKNVIETLTELPDGGANLAKSGKLEKMHNEFNSFLVRLPELVGKELKLKVAWLHKDDNFKVYDSAGQNVLYESYLKRVKGTISNILRELETILKKYSCPIDKLDYNSWSRFYSESLNNEKIQEVKLQKILGEIKNNYKQIATIHEELSQNEKTQHKSKIAELWSQTKCD